MKYELLSNLTDNLPCGISAESMCDCVSNNLQNIMHGKSAIEANRDVVIKKILAQKELGIEMVKATSEASRNKSELAKEALRAVTSMSDKGELTDTRMLATYNFVIAMSSELSV